MFSREQSQQIKGMAILLLLFHHMFFYQPRLDANQVTAWLLSAQQLNALAVAARICVWIFAFVSAYGITVLYNEKPVSMGDSRFIWQRWVSLMSGLWFLYPIILLALTAYGANPVSKYNGQAVNLLLDWMGWADFFGTPMLSGVFWYMCFAQILVLLMPLLIRFCKAVGPSALLITYVAMQYVPTGAGLSSVNGGAYLQYFPVLILGILCAQYAPHREVSGIKRIFLWGGFIVAFELLIWGRFRLVAEDFPYNNRNLQSVFYSVAAVIYCILITRMISGVPARVLAFLGKHSGNMFLIHMLFISYLPKIVFGTKTVLLSWLTVLVLSLVASILVEKLKRRLRYDALIRQLRENSWESAKDAKS